MVWIEAIVFTTSNILAGFFNYFLSKDNMVENLVNTRNSGSHFSPLFATIMIPYFILTEFIPAVTFAYTVDKLAKVLSGEINERNEEQER